jgi:tetratricopeptide (TPR) repeat protein
LIILSLIGIGFYCRKRAPALSAGLLFFFTGHALESSTLPLELYFEHRNYVPALLLFWPLSRAVIYANRSRTIRSAIAASLLALLAITTCQRATIWGHQEQLAELWASLNPSSSRAQATAAIMDIDRGRSQRAMDRLLPLWRQRPNDLQIALNYVNAACATQGLARGDAEHIARTLRHANQGTLLVRQWLEKSLQTASTGRCRGLTLSTVEIWLDAAQKNPAINTPKTRAKSMPSLLGLVALEKHEPEKALEYFDLSLAANDSPDVAAGQVAALASHGYYVQALKHLDTYERMKKPDSLQTISMPNLHNKVLNWQGYWPHELAVLRAKLENEIAAEQLHSDRPH